MPLTTIEKFGIVYRDKEYKNLKSIYSPDWLKSSIIYEVYIRSFSKDGNISALIKKIPELKDLGVNILWLMPLQIIGHLKRKGPLGCPYAIRDYYRINPMYGNNDDFKNLVDVVHKQDMKILIDLVANHTANDHIETKNHPDWFRQDEKGNFTRQIPGWSDIIDLNYNNKELWKYMKDVVLYWTKEFGIDGYRCDVAGMVPQNFWIEVKKELLKINPEFILLAEWEDPEMHIDAFDVTYDWVTYYQLYDIYTGVKPAQEAIELVLERKQQFPQNALRLRFLENHDQARASYKFSLTAFRAFTTFIFMLDGIPLIYNGQEVGETKYLSLFDKNPINWKIKGAQEIKKFFKFLIELRKSSALFTEGDTLKIPNSKPKQIVSFMREKNGQKAVVVLNFSKQACAFNLQTQLTQTSWIEYNIKSLDKQSKQIEDWNTELEPGGGKIFISE